MIEDLCNRLNFLGLNYFGASAVHNDSMAIASNDESGTPSELGGSYYTGSVAGHSENNESIESSSVNASTHDLNVNNDESVNMHAIAYSYTG